MITLKTSNFEHQLKPTIFPDGTSQVWKLPQEILSAKVLTVVWNFEAEREVMDLFSLRRLLPWPQYQLSLHVPFMPYSRQDKQVGNESTFNLRVIADIVNSLNFDEVTSVDVHNPTETAKIINRFKNIEVLDIHSKLVSQMEPTFLVFPDAGSKNRYANSALSYIPRLVCDKTRDQLTGQILDHTISYVNADGELIKNISIDKLAKPGNKFLIIDDICDGGATFIGIANKLRSQVDGINIFLFVTHGIFSKGRDILFNNGIRDVYTTNSLLKNKDGYEV